MFADQEKYQFRKTFDSFWPYNRFERDYLQLADVSKLVKKAPKQ
jgi:hypothetical protein